MNSLPTTEAERNEVDQREQLANDGERGPVTKISIGVDEITKLRGILFDLDLKLMRLDGDANVAESPAVFYEETVKEWLERDPTLAKAEVRDSGGGLHVILRFAEPLVFDNDRERKEWASIVQTVQAALPIDPDQPGINAMTRAIGSVNSKNNRQVTRLAEGEGVTPEEVRALYEKMASRPFETVAGVLFGSNAISPCPVCGDERTQLRAMQWHGLCYGSCGNVSLDRLYDLFLLPRQQDAERVEDVCHA